MIYDAAELARVRNPVLLISAAAWIVLLVEPGSAVAHCAAVGSAASFRMLLAMNSPASLAVGWALMLVAMMSPVLIPPLRHIRLGSFRRRRGRSMGLFVAGYGAIWMALGGGLLAAELAAKAWAPQSYWPAMGVMLIALVWQMSPIKQRCLNRCHRHTALAAFGAAADLDALRFGAMHGIWCAGSCWALMLFPMLLPRGHMLAMAMVALLIFSERLEQPMPLGWRWRGFGKLMRIVMAQARIRWQAARVPALQSG